MINLVVWKLEFVSEKQLKIDKLKPNIFKNRYEMKKLNQNALKRQLAMKDWQKKKGRKQEKKIKFVK